MTSITIKPNSKSLREIKVNTTPSTVVKDIVNEYAKVHKTSEHRIRLTKVDETGKSKEKVALKYDETVDQNGLRDGDEIFAKDLGPQVSWRTVFLVEYFGPILLNTIFYYGVYDASNVTLTQNVAYIIIMLHFFKREYESTFIHSFSKATMPIFNLYKNCTHYWFVSGLCFGITLFHNNDFEGSNKLVKFIFHVRDCSKDQLILICIVWALAELGNYVCHVQFQNLRKGGFTGHKIPYGFLFEYVTCPNYTFEILGWLMFAILTNNWSSWVFFFVGSGQMIIWAIKKHELMRREFPNYPKSRTAVFPYIL